MTKSARAPCGLRAYPGTSDTRHILLAAALGDTGNAILQPRRRVAAAGTQSLSRLTGVRSLGTRGGHALHVAAAVVPMEQPSQQRIGPRRGRNRRIDVVALAGRTRRAARKFVLDVATLSATCGTSSVRGSDQLAMVDDALPVYDSIAHVFEPESVAPGAQFRVRHRAKRNGRATTVVKESCRATGAAPIVVAPVVEMAEGQRHANRSAVRLGTRRCCQSACPDDR